jgi:uncharacterized protein YceK
MRRLTLLLAFVAAALLASGCGSNISQQAGLDAAGQVSSSDAQIVDTPVDAGSPADTGTATQLPDASLSDAATAIQNPDATLADAATPVQIPDAAMPADAATPVQADVGDFDAGVITVHGDRRCAGVGERGEPRGRRRARAWNQGGRGAPARAAPARARSGVVIPAAG